MSGKSMRAGVTAVVLALVVVGGCGDDGTPALSDEEVVERLQFDGHTRAGAECVLEGTSVQGVDLGRIMSRMQVTQQERDVITSVAGYCFSQHGTADDTDSSVVGPVAPSSTEG
jgi:hypothetical protein